MAGNPWSGRGSSRAPQPNRAVRRHLAARAAFDRLVAKRLLSLTPWECQQWYEDILLAAALGDEKTYHKLMYGSDETVRKVIGEARERARSRPTEGRLWALLRPAAPSVGVSDGGVDAEPRDEQVD